MIPVLEHVFVLITPSVPLKRRRTFASILTFLLISIAISPNMCMHSLGVSTLLLSLMEPLKYGKPKGPALMRLKITANGLEALPKER